MQKKLKRALIVSILLGLFALTGCNTVKGIGEDFESLGQSMQNAGE
jgi:predicted small secreted protein